MIVDRKWLSCDTLTMRSPGELVDRFRSEGLKVTPQRELVFRLLHLNSAHPTADSVYAAARAEMPMISLKTVYQVLHDLRELGEIQTIEVGSGALRFDPNTSDHHHLVCSSCDRVADVNVDVTPLSVSRNQRNGFTVESVEVTFRGTCQQCRIVP
jgi:Fur family transcriptional regulator, peroxide stress response regulator